MLNFAWPWMILLLPAPLVIAKFKNKLAAKKIQQLPVIMFPRLQQLSKAFMGTSTSAKYKLKNWRILLLSVAWICLVIALMRPELIEKLAYAENTGYDLMLAVDLSRSMETIDFRDNGKPISRIEATKKVVTNFVKQRSGDRIGLIVFAEQAYLTIPLTLDSASVAKLLNNLIVGMAGESTAIGDAIGLGVKNLRKRPPASRVLILLTDGADTSSHIPPLEAVKIAATDKIKIYTIGVGDKLDDALLKKIADMTGGTYSKVTSVDALEAVYKQIDKLEKSESKQQALLIRTPLYNFVLLISLVALGIIFIVDSKQYKQYRYDHVTE